MTATELLTDLTQLGIQLEARDGRLRYHPQSAVTPDLIEHMKAHKVQLLALLQAPTIDRQPPTAAPAVDGEISELSEEDIEWAMTVWESPLPSAAEKLEQPQLQPSRWNPATSALIAWYAKNRDGLPEVPLILGPGRCVTAHRTFYASLDRDIECGPTGPRAVGLGCDLAGLQRICHQCEKLRG